ncbi:lipase maturation factor family protein [Mucilaginibacter sp. UR6-11]|uniref:lipase maturation factor family protein n=1 Tax=Mucilaginibacter sp. UR6-11 TaxID=1435644 RepID=UPI001E6429E5|nr:lipase maturation factor family protein [Mucilaginibacter sp. UR6-11]MCC8426505.1 lipase maturation factor family protein [Mucilaginibacter sp. UR6-11]
METVAQTGYSTDTTDAIPTYWLTRFVILRLLGVVYAVAFMVAVNQLIPLIGAHGLLPAGNYLEQVSNALGPAGGFIRLPSLFWFWHTDTALLTVAWLGLVLSIVVITGFANAPLLSILWACYLSIVHIGQDWYGYGWEIQLTETGFLAIFLCPLIDMRPFPKRAPSTLIIILFRWLAFRIMLGAGLIKYRGDKIWRDATALYYYFETQPIPGPLTRWFHFLPHALLKIGVWFNWLAELVALWFVFGPRMARHIAGGIIILFQLAIVLSGNLSFLNWLTIVPALACFDDGFWAKLLPKRLVLKAKEAAEHAEESKPMTITAWIVTGLVAILSIQPVINILSPGQVMNTSFDPLDLVNTYGAFGSVGQERYNVIFEGTVDDTTGNKARWQPYIYKGLPVLLNKRPPQIAPYQLRLDWQMWFAAMSTAQQYPWTYNLAWKLLHNDADATSLFAVNPFPDKPPRFIRATLYRYKFARPGNPQGLVWTREEIGEWLPVLSTGDERIIKYLKYQGWIR